jgi:hypothetical protein
VAAYRQTCTWKQRLPAPAELLPRLAVGDVRAVSADLDAAMKASELSHLTAVSGLQIGPELHQPWASDRSSARLHRPRMPLGRPGLEGEKVFAPHVSG